MSTPSSSRQKLPGGQICGHCLSLVFREIFLTDWLTDWSLLPSLRFKFHFNWQPRRPWSSTDQSRASKWCPVSVDQSCILILLWSAAKLTEILVFKHEMISRQRKLFVKTEQVILMLMFLQILGLMNSAQSCWFSHLTVINDAHWSLVTANLS